jgi:hypothetical protein
MGNEWIGDVRCGLHSGFPRCCIKFFIGPWSRMPRPERVLYLTSMPNGHGPGYVPCPDCVASKNFVQVKPCPVGSHDGNVIGSSVSHYEDVNGNRELVAVEFFYRDRPGSYRLPVVDGQCVRYRPV